jgi:hypothetical protein
MNIYFNKLIQIIYTAIACCLLACCSNSDNDIEVRQLTIQNHLFSPEEILIPANTKIKLIIHNKDNQAEEFECPALRREKIIPSNASASIIITPLKQGIYEFFGEFNKDTAQGRIKVE